jgi:RNA polymerase sigma-70 factor (ECF subfamily)
MADHRKLATAFIAALPAADRASYSRVADLGVRLARLAASARAAWPGASIADEAFAAYVAHRLPPGGGGDALAEVHGEDLYLTAACAAGDGGALRAFDAAFSRELDIVLARLGVERTVGDEVRQVLRTKLFVPEPGAPPKIASYSGRGDLRSWVRAAAVRTAIDVVRGTHRERPVPEVAFEDLPAAADDPELAYLKELYRAEFKDAFAAALASLKSRDRTVLRYKLIDGFGLDQIAAVYGVHRATVARWLAITREELLAHTRRALRARLAVGDPELDSIMRLIDSQLDVSIGGELAAVED